MSTKPETEIAVNSFVPPTITSEQREMVKRTIFPDATDDELELFIYDCRRQGVHPFDRMIHPTRRKIKDDEYRYVPITSIDFLRTRAFDTGQHAGTSEPEYTFNGVTLNSAKISVFKMVEGNKCEFTATAYWEEYYPKEEKARFMWDKMPRTMLAKCAEAVALRKAFPKSLNGLYSVDEMQQAIESEKPVKTPTQAPRRASERAPITDVSKELVALLAESCDQDPDLMATKLKKLTTWTDKAGVIHEGKEDLAHCSPKVQQFALRDLKKEMGR